MVKHKQAQETKSKVKLYKTKRGWFSALTRFFGLLSFMSKKEVQPIDLNDLDALKDADTSDNYKKGIATVATLFGMGAIGAVSPTEVHAATTTVDYSSQVIGSGSTSVSTSTSQSMTSTSGSTASQSTSTSTVSQSMQSNSLSVNSVSGSTTSTTIFEGTTTSSMVSENSSNSISGSQAIENSNAASIDQSGSHSNSTTADSITGSTSLDNEKTSIEESASTSYLEENGMATILPVTGNNDGETSVANRTVTEDNIVQLAESIKEVSNEEELKAALQDASITTIKLKNNITLNNAITINNENRNITIIGDGHYINALNSDGGIILNNNSGSAKIDLTIENATLYNTSKYGFVNMSSNGADTVTYKDVTAYGGTLVWSKPVAGVKTLNLVGNTTLNSVISYEVDGQSHNTEMFSQITQVSDKETAYKSTALYVSNAINIADDANVVLKNSATDIDMWLLTNTNVSVLSSSNESTVTVGSNASLTMENIGNTEYNIKLDGAWYNNFIVNENAAVKMSAKVDNVRIIPQLENILARENIDLAKGSNVHLEVVTGSNFRMAGTFANKINFNGTATLIKHEGTNDTSMYGEHSQANIEFNWLGIGGNAVNFNPGSDVTLVAGKGASNIGAFSSVNATATVNINDPLRVAFNTDKLGTDQNGVTYLGDPRIVVNVKDATIKVDDNDFSELISSNKTNITGSSVAVGSVSLNSNSTSYANESESLSASLSFSIATSMATSQLAAVNNGSQVIYGGSTSIYNSQSMSASLSLSTSASLSESLSTSLSESLSTSVSLSESISTSISLSESLSTSLSESLSTSVSLSESISASTSLSESLSTSLSESLSNSVSMSESLSNSVSMSESLSNSVSMSESLSNSVSMSESMSNSVSMSESLSNSVSMSESLSNSVSMSESISNSVSMSESISNSVSMSESLSNSVSMSESMSNSVSMSESLSNSVSMSESLSNSVS
ncbi:serine-rich glycoprotein adhesin, partial [Limosilactobacillus reuteri]